MIITDNILRLMDPRDRPKGNAGRTFAQCESERVKRLEREEHRIFANWLNQNEFPYIHANPVKKSTIQVGAPDFEVYWSGKVLFLEFKTSLGKFSPEQTEFLQRLIVHGFPVYIPYTAVEAIEITKRWKNSLLAEQ